MVEEIKVPEAPVVVEPKAPEESLIDNRRAEIENLVIAENATIPEPEPSDDEPVVKTEEPKKEESPKVDEAVSDDPIERMKKSVSKRIGKEVAKRKTLEEELADTKAELERLKTNPQPIEPTTKDDAPPTVDQIEAYIIKMREEGNVKEEIAATRYLIKVEKELAIKSVKDEQETVRKQTEVQKAKQLADWTMLSKDYETANPKDEMNLSNQSGLLYKTALALYNDKELHADHYNNPDVIQGFRRAVADAYREIHQQGLLKETPKEEVEMRTNRFPLADPSMVEAEEVQSSSTKPLSDTDKVREEIKARKKNLYIKR